MSREAETRRPGIVTVAIVLHSAAVIFLISLGIYLLWLARSPEILREQDAADAVRGLKMGALAVTIPALFWIPGVYAMWRRRGWGWWLTLITGAGTASVLIYSAIDDGWHALDMDDVTVTAVFLALPLILLWPRVRKYYRTQSSPALHAAQEIAQLS